MTYWPRRVREYHDIHAPFPYVGQQAGATVTLSEWLLARIAEDEAVARAAIADETQEHTYWDGSTKTFVDSGEWHTRGKPGDYDECRIEGTFMTIYDEGGHSPEQARHIVRWNPANVLVECEAKRRIVELHRSWPVLVERPEAIGETVVDSSDPTALTFRVAKHIAWLTQEEYRKRFGDEPPTAPMLAALAEVYADRPGYDERWRP